MSTKLIWGSDLYKGFKLDKNTLLGGAINDITPFQMLSMEEKTIDWVKAVADYYDIAGWSNVERKASKIQRNYWMRYGKLNPNDYIVNPEVNPFSSVVGWLVPPESQSPLEQFYSLAPTFVDVLRGEFIKRDNTWTIEAIDPQSKSEMFQHKEDGFRQIVTQVAMMQKQQSLAEMGLTEEVDPETYMQEMDNAMKQLTEVELKAKSFKTTGIKWAEKVLKIQERRYNLHEIEPDAFESGLISDCEFWHLDLMDDDFKLELLNPKWCDYHKGPNVKYVSEGDYFLWFDFMSAGDIVNKYGKRMKEEDILKLKEIYMQTANIIVPDYLKSHQGSYYDLSKNWTQATDLDPKMNDHFLGQELAYNYMRSPNFDHNIDVDIFNPVWGKNITGKPSMFRVMRLYWRSMKRIGWLTKIHRDGTLAQPPDWVDENFQVTVEPEYDISVTKVKTKDNLIYGEHIDWTWVPEWRHVIKISANHRHNFWAAQENKCNDIYIDGDPVKFQFKGKTNPFDSLPPVEGCSYSYINTDAHSFIDRIKGLQIIYNICMNRVPRKFLSDHGLKVAIDKRSISTFSSNVNDGQDPLEGYHDLLRESDILPYSVTRDALEGAGQPALPTVLNLSTAQEAQMYLQVADQIKWMAGESIGITRQRMGAQKASETATGIEQGISYSETQTEKYYEQHSNLMQRVRQRMLDAAQYYTTFNKRSREVYMNDRDENIFVDIEGMDNLLTHYNIHLQSRANVRSALQTISGFLMNENTLPIKPSAKLEALISSSIPTIMSVVRESELEQERKEAAQFEAEMAQRQRESEIAQQTEMAKLQHEQEQAQADRETEIEVATIRAMGGLQSDINANGQIDSQENLNAQLKGQEIANKRATDSEAIKAKRRTDTEKMMLEREKAAADIQKEKIKQEGALKVAKENKQKGEK